MIQIRKFQKDDLKDAIKIWNEVVSEGIAFPQIDLLNEKGGFDFFTGV